MARAWRPLAARSEHVHPQGQLIDAGRTDRASDFLATFWRHRARIWLARAKFALPVVYGTEGQRFESSRARYQLTSPIALQTGGFSQVLVSLPDGNNGGNRATPPGAGETSHPGVYAADRVGWRSTSRTAAAQGSAATFREAREIKIRPRRARTRAGRRADAAHLRAGVGRSLRRSWRQRRHQRPHSPRVPASADHLRAGLLRPRRASARHRRQRLRGFVDWLCRLSEDPMCAGCATARCTTPCCRCSRLPAPRARGRPGVDDIGAAIMLPRRRRGRAYEFDERRFLTQRALARLLAEIPEQWRTLFELLASTGLRISEAIGAARHGRRAG